MTKRLTRLLLLCVLSTTPLFAIAPQYENQRIEKVNINIHSANTSASDEQAVKSCIRMKEGEFFSQNQFDTDLKALAQSYNQVEPKVEVIDEALCITLDVWPKPTINSIEFFGNDGIKTRYLRKELDVKRGSVYDRKSFTEAFRKLKQYYVKQGYFEAQLDYHVEINPDCNEATITVTIEEGRAGKIEQICFEGFYKYERSDILEKMYTKEYSMFFSWLNEQGTYNEEMIQQDQYMIINYMHDNGFADAKVEIEVRESPCTNRIVLVIRVDRGAYYTLGNITVEGNCIFTEEQIRNKFVICEGGADSPLAIRDTISAIQDMYGRKGYIDALVDYEPKLRVDCPVYDVHITISEGDQYRVGLIKVFGNCSTFTTTILHETLLIPGEVFNTDKIKATEARLNNVGFFKNVNVYAVRSEGNSLLGDCYRDVHIEVEETGTGNISAFGGLSTMESLFAGVKLTEKNFNWRGIGRLHCDGMRGLRGAGEYINLSGTWGLKSRTYSLSWTKPYFRDTRWSVGFDITSSSNRYVSNDYTINSGGFSIYALHQHNAFMRSAVHYRLTNSAVFIDKKLHRTPLMEDEARLSGLISAVGAGFTYDSTDSIERPTRGFKSRLEAEFAGVGGDHCFISTAYLNSFYWQAAPNGVFRFRADLKFIQPLAWTSRRDIPLDERFFLGGDELVRGFRPYAIGPTYENTDDPRGGISLQYLSLEYDYRIFSALDFFTFVDSGHVSLRTWDFGKMSTAVGWGFKFKAFASGPPIVLGFGYPINAKNRSEIKRFFISMGTNF